MKGPNQIRSQRRTFIAVWYVTPYMYQQPIDVPDKHEAFFIMLIYYVTKDVSMTSVPSNATSELDTLKDAVISIHRHDITVLCGKGKAVPLQARSGPEGSRKLRFLDFMTTAQDGGKVVSLRHRPTLPPGNAPGTHFC